MNLGWKHLAGQLLNGADLSKASLEEIDILLDEYPYFAGLHFLKAAKVKALQPEELSDAYARAALYFPNPHWFSLMLDHSVPKDSEAVSVAVPQDFIPVAEVEVEPVGFIQETGTDLANEQNNWAETSDDPIPEMQEPASQPQPDWEQSLAENPVFQQHQVSDEEQVEKEIWQQQATEPVAEFHIEETLATHIENIEIEEAEVTHTVDTSSTDESSIHIPSEDTIPEEVVLQDPAPAAEADMQQMEAEPVESGFADPGSQPEVENVQETEVQPVEQADTPSPAEPALAELDIPFEPLYTIDYFASQGIKIAAEASPKDQLSLKLRSFTEWLRAMKKLHPEKIDKDFNQDQEEQVRVIAESSNAPQIVYTEAMAEVFIKQGKKDKARQVFEKLSLLDPGKSAYFAVRIKELKEN